MENLVIDPEFWKGRRVFLTGHTGFKGSWMSAWLYQLGAKVTGYALEPPTNPSLFNDAAISKCLVKEFTADICDSKLLNSAITESQPEIVIHMAAQSLVRESYSEPVNTYATNVMGTVNILEASRSIPSVKAVLNITSDKCYDNKEWVWGYRENDPMGGYDPYSSSKGCAELVTAAYRNSFFSEAGIAVATARAGNVIGGGDWAKDRIVPDAMRAFMANLPLVVRNPKSIRPWQHVLEPLSGYLQLCQQLFIKPDDFSQGWNFGPSDDDAEPVAILANIMANGWGEGASWSTDQKEHPHEAHYLKLDCSKANLKLNWKPVWKLDHALDATVQWYKAWHNKQDMHEFTMDQIKAYQQELLKG